jgi:hypothetical protein
MIKELIKLADHLDSKGMHKEADYVDALVKKAGLMDGAQSFFDEMSGMPDWWPAIHSELVQMGMKYTVLGAAAVLASHSGTLLNTLKNKGPKAAAKLFMELHP